MTIKLSLFMLNPVKAHEDYRKEIQSMQDKIDKMQEVNKSLKANLKAMTDKYKQQKSAYGVVSTKLGEERKQNELWSNQ